MAKSTKATKKGKAKIGRPKSTGAGAPMVVRMHKPQIKAIDLWIASQGGDPLSRPEAIRRLVDRGLAPPAAPVRQPGTPLFSSNRGR